MSRLSFAQFQIHEIYMTGSSTNHFGGDLRRARFILTCNPEGTHFKLAGGLTWQDRFCLAILDYRKRIPLQVACKCPHSSVVVDVRGTAHGRPVHERVTPCLCEDSPDAARDARVMLTTHPPV